MAKVHTGAKRRLGIRSTTRRHRFWFTRVEAKKGARSFATKEAAQAWAKENDIDMKTHVLYELQGGKKLQWRAKPRV